MESNWRSWLIKSLEDDPATKKEHEKQLARDAIALAAIVLFFEVPITSLAYAAMESSKSFLGAMIPLAILLLTVGPILSFSQRFINRMRSGSARDLLLIDPRKPILYLRSFAFEEAMQGAWKISKTRRSSGASAWGDWARNCYRSAQ